MSIAVVRSCLKSEHRGHTTAFQMLRTCLILSCVGRVVCSSFHPCVQGGLQSGALLTFGPALVQSLDFTLQTVILCYVEMFNKFFEGKY